MPTCAFTPTLALKFFRLEAASVLFTSNQYTRAQKSNDYTIVYTDQDTRRSRFGLIEYFIELQNTYTGDYAAFALVKTLEVEKFVCADIALSHLLRVKESSLSVIPVAWITSKSLFVEVGSNAFVAEPLCECVRLSC